MVKSRPLYFDLSSDIEIEDHPVPPTPRSYDGHILPIAIVVNGTGPNNERLGVHTYHWPLSFKMLGLGQKWTELLYEQNHISNGLAGVNFYYQRLNLSDLFLSSFSSFGGLHKMGHLRS